MITSVSRSAVLALVGPVAAAGAIAGTAFAPRIWLVVPVLAGQVLLVLAWLALLDSPGGLGGFLLALGAAGAADGLLLSAQGPQVSRLLPVAGVGLVVALAHQLTRRPRTGMTASLAGELSAVLLVLAFATLLGLRAATSGAAAVVAVAVGVAAAGVAARLVDLAVRRVPGALRWVRVSGTGARSWLGLLAGLAAAAGAGYGDGSRAAGISPALGLRLAVVAGLLSLAAGLLVDLAGSSLPVEPGGSTDRQRAALPPAHTTLPLALAAPAVYLAGRVLLG
jgi:hypothetical protein